MSEPTTGPRRKIAGESRRRPPAGAGAPETDRPDTNGEAASLSSTATDLPPDGDAHDVTSATAPTGSIAAQPPAAPAFGHIPNWLLVGLGVLLLAAVVFDAIVGIRSNTAADQRTTSSAAVTSALRQAPVQAETAAVRALAFDYKTLQADADEAKSYMTPAYAATFQKTVDDLLTAPANQRKAHVEADVKASGVVSVTVSKVEVMLFVDQTSQTTLQSQPQTYLNRVVFTMVKSGDRWLVDEITAL